MKDVFAKRLKSARLLSALSLDKLAETMDGIVSKNAISKYEKAEMMPSSKVLIALAKALSVKPDYFFRPFSVEIKNIEFRKKSKLKIKKEKAIKQQVSDHIERYLEIESLLNISVNFQNPISDIEINNSVDVEKAVNTLLKKWNLGLNALPNVIELLEDKEVKIVEIDTEENFDGLSGWANGKIPVVVVNKNLLIERKRFTVLHELAHLLLNFNKNLDNKTVEKLCHCFAGAVLIPKKTFITELGKNRKTFSLNELISVKETYGISIQAIMARAYGLRIITKFKYIDFCIKANTNKKEDGWGEYKGKEQSDRFMQLIYRAAAENIISMSKAANLSNKKLASFRTEFAAI